MKFGDIFICRSVHVWCGSKPRPALVLFDLGLDVVICRMTSAAHSGVLDVPVVDWAAAGLAKPSVVRLNRLVTAEKSLLDPRIGELSDADQQSIRAVWNAHMLL